MKTSTGNRLARSLIILAGVLVIAGCGGAASRLQSHLQRGRDYMGKGDYVHANIEFRNALQIAPKDTSARLLSADVAVKLGQLREAVGLYQAVIDTAPDNVEARAGLGRVYMFVGAPARALGDRRAGPDQTSGRRRAPDGEGERPSQNQK